MALFFNVDICTYNDSIKLCFVTQVTHECLLTYIVFIYTETPEAVTASLHSVKATQDEYCRLLHSDFTCSYISLLVSF